MSILALITGGTSDSRPAMTRDQLWRRAWMPEASVRRWDHERPMSVASLKVMTWRERKGTSWLRISEMSWGKLGRRARWRRRSSLQRVVDGWERLEEVGRRERMG